MKIHWACCPSQCNPEMHRNAWLMREGARPELYVVREQDQRGCDEPLDLTEVNALLTRWSADRAARAELVKLYKWLREVPLRIGAPDSTIDQTVLPRLRQLFERRELLLLRARVVSASGAGPAVDAFLQRVQAKARALSPADRQPEKTWVEFRLINQKGLPVPGAKYRLKSTDGSVRVGSLDQDGSVRLQGIDPGTCEISFLDYDAREWKRVA